MIGLFDGLHLGHMSAVNELLRCEGEKIVYTFNSSTVFTKGARKLLMTDCEKREMLLSLGVDEVISEDFNDIKDMFGWEFLKSVILARLKASKIICGEDFRFGKNAHAGAAELKKYCEELGIKLSLVPYMCLDGEPISTTRIRALLESGNIFEANKLLGRDYSVPSIAPQAEICEKGHSLNSLSLSVDPTLLLPPPGKYFAKVMLRKRAVPATVYITTDNPNRAEAVFSDSDSACLQESLEEIAGLEIQLRFAERLS